MAGTVYQIIEINISATFAIVRNLNFKFEMFHVINRLSFVKIKLNFYQSLILTISYLLAQRWVFEKRMPRFF